MTEVLTVWRSAGIWPLFYRALLRWWEEQRCSSNGFLCEGLTEGETLFRLRKKLDRYRTETDAAIEFRTVRLEVYRT